MTDLVRISDPASGAVAEIAPGFGFNCISFTLPVGEQTVSVIDSPADVRSGAYRLSGFGIPILFPFPNRIRAGRFAWDGRSYEIPLPEGKPNAIHGFCYDRPWRVIDQTSSSVTGRFQLSVDDPGRAPCWPADFLFEVRYRVEEDRLECQYWISNPSPNPLPWGLGTHAYFRLPFGGSSSPADCLFSVDVSEEWELQDYLPAGRRHSLPADFPLRTGARFGSVNFDNVFTGWSPDGLAKRCSILDEKAGIELNQSCDAHCFREAVVFTPPGRNAVCIEPYTCVTDAINLQPQGLDAGLRILAPGENVQTWTAIEVCPVLA